MVVDLLLLTVVIYSGFKLCASLASLHLLDRIKKLLQTDDLCSYISHLVFIPISPDKQSHLRSVAFIV